MDERETRRAFFTVVGASALLAACRNDERATPDATHVNVAPLAVGPDAQAPQKEKADDVGAVEDLMREHGAIRRVLIVYREAAVRLRTSPASVPPAALQRAAKLMRAFGEDYHERKLEEAHIFPAVNQAGGALAATVSTLLAQHQRGRDITDYILAVTQKIIAAQNAEPLARTLEAFSRMYEEHTAIEDTIVFPAWKKGLSAKELDEIGDRFEDIEHTTFGKDGFDDAVGEVAAIETSLGIDLARFTPPPPPKL